MDIVSCNPVSNLEQIKDVKKRALKDADAYDEEDEEPDYSSFECFLVCKSDDFIVGTVGFRQPKGDVVKNLELGENVTEIKNMHILPGYQRKGYASKLMSKLEERAVKEGYERMVLRTTSVQEYAHRFYESNGYEMLGQVDPSYKSIDYDLVFFGKKL